MTTPSSNSEPAMTAAGAAAAVIGFVTLVVTRLNRSVDFLNPAEMGDLKTWLSLAAPISAALWIRRHVTPNKKVEERAASVEAMVYAKALEDQPVAPVEPPPPPAPVKAAKAAKAAPKRR